MDNAHHRVFCRHRLGRLSFGRLLDVERPGVRRVRRSGVPPFWSLVLHGQTTIVILGGFWAGWLALERRRPFLAGPAFGLLLIKPQFAIVLALTAVTCGEWELIAGALPLWVAAAEILVFCAVKVWNRAACHFVSISGP